jgi:hypothetical protein
MNEGLGNRQSRLKLRCIKNSDSGGDVGRSKGTLLTRPVDAYPVGPYIYWIGAPGTELPIKVGYSALISRRLREILLHSPVRVDLIAFMPGTRRRERQLQASLSDYRTHGEWFARGPALALAQNVQATFFLEQGECEHKPHAVLGHPTASFCWHCGITLSE